MMRARSKKRMLLGCGLSVAVFSQSALVEASSTCTFSVAGTTWTLSASCTTDATLYVPDGYTLDGAGFTITAVDPNNSFFQGAVVQNLGSRATIRNVRITTSNLKNQCGSGVTRLKGIALYAASGSIESCTVENLTRGSSACEEGNAIDVSNPPFDGSHPLTMTVSLTNNLVSGYQKTGIAVNGDVYADIVDNTVGRASTQSKVAANSVQIGYGAHATLKSNSIEGNQWDVISEPQLFSTAILLYQASDIVLKGNLVQGTGTDVGAAIFQSSGVSISGSDLVRTLSQDDVIDAYGVGLWFSANAGGIRIGRNTFSGWKARVQVDSSARVEEGVSPYEP